METSRLPQASRNPFHRNYKSRKNRLMDTRLQRQKQADIKKFEEMAEERDINLKKAHKLGTEIQLREAAMGRFSKSLCEATTYSEIITPETLAEGHAKRAAILTEMAIPEKELDQMKKKKVGLYARASLMRKKIASFSYKIRAKYSWETPGVEEVLCQTGHSREGAKDD